MASAQTFNVFRIGCWLLSCLVTRWPSPVRLAARGPLACSPPPPRFPAPPRLPPHARAYRGRARWRRAPAQTEQRPRAQRSLLRPSVACARCCLRCYPRRPPLSFPGTSPESNVAMRARCAPRRVHGADSHPCPHRLAHTEQRPLLRPSVARVRCRSAAPAATAAAPTPSPVRLVRTSESNSSVMCRVAGADNARTGHCAGPGVCAWRRSPSLSALLSVFIVHKRPPALRAGPHYGVSLNPHHTAHGREPRRAPFPCSSPSSQTAR